MENPLLEKLRQAHHLSSLSRREYRIAICKQFAWAVPTRSVIKRIVEYSPLVEVGAGTGYWASLIKEMGGDIICYDEAPYNNPYCDGRYYRVKRGGAEKLALHPDRTLFLCWPPYDKSMAEECLCYHNGKHVIYVGEEQGGCCADDWFFDKLGDEYKLVSNLLIPQWDGVHDSVHIYEKVLKDDTSQNRPVDKRVQAKV